MAINEWLIWKKMGIVKEKEKEVVKIKDDLAAVISFLQEMDVSELAAKLEKMRSIVQEGKVVGEELQPGNLEEQLKLFDEILQKYTFFTNDADINELRLKKVGKELLKRAEAKGMDVKEKRKDMKWR